MTEGDMHPSPRKVLCRVGLITLVLGGGALPAPSLALASPACGVVLGHSVKLHSSMNCPSGTALYPGSNGITINLNGFTISGGDTGIGIDNTGDWPSTAPGSGGTPGPGTGFNHVTVENGKITAFQTGVKYMNTSGMKLSNITVTDNTGDGLQVYSSRSGSVTGSHFGTKSNGNGADGVDMSGNAKMTFTDDSFNFNFFFGIDDDASQATLNHVRANHNDVGVVVGAPVSPYLVENSKASGNNGDGFHVADNHIGTIRFVGNTAENDSGWGFFAAVQAAGKNNGYEKDSFGGCHKVGGCHLNP
jgi:hypothetical protein